MMLREDVDTTEVPDAPSQLPHHLASSSYRQSSTVHSECSLLTITSATFSYNNLMTFCLICIQDANGESDPNHILDKVLEVEIAIKLKLFGIEVGRGVSDIKVHCLR